MAALVCSGLAAVLATWPLAAHLGRALPHDPRFTAPEGSDVHLFLWNLWWAAEAGERGVGPWFTDMVFAPVGHSLALHTHTLLYGILAAPITRGLGAPWAFGFALLLLFATTCLATYALARLLALRPAPAAFCAAAFGLSPYFLQKGLEHLNLTASPLAPLLLCALVLWRRGGRGAGLGALGAGGVGGAALWVDGMAALWLLVLGVLFVLLGVPGELRWRTDPKDSAAVPKGSGPLGGAAPLFGQGLLVLAGLLPLALPYFQELRRELRSIEALGPIAGASGALERNQLYHPEFLDFLTPPGLHPLARVDGQPSLGAARPREGAAYFGPRAEHAGLYLPISALLLAAFALGRAPGTRRYGLLGLVFLVLAWDPGPDPVGYLASAYRSLPGLDMLRVPARALPYGWLCVSLLAGAGCARLFSAGRARVLGPPLGLALAFELCAAPYPLTPWRVPAAVAALEPKGEVARERARAGGAVLTLPLLPGSNPALSWQTVHGRPVVHGYFARTHPAVLARLGRLAPGLFGFALGGPMPQAEELRLELDLLGVDFVLLDLRALGDPEAALDRLDGVAGFERRPEGEGAGGGPGPDGVLLWARSSAIRAE